MGKFMDLAGQRFGRLVVLEKTERPYNLKNKSIYWKCQCDCGETVIVRSTSLKRKMTTSCGCKLKETWGIIGKLNKNKKPAGTKPEGIAALNSLYGQYKYNAKKRNLEFNISKEIFKNLTKQNCYYCGQEPSQICKRNRCNGVYVYNGIDRLYSNIGYILDNVVPCCGQCNVAKMAIGADAFILWINKVYNNINKDDSLYGIDQSGFVKKIILK